jgi:mRNA interferase MazF
MDLPQKRDRPSPHRGDVFLARLDPIEGSEQAGTRPVAVITRDAINDNSPVVVVVPFTDANNPKRIYPSHVWLPRGSAGLRMDSIAKCEQIRAIAVSRLISFCGKLSESQIAELEQAIRITLALR